MIRPLQEVSIPEVQLGDVEGLSQRFDQMTTEKLPAFVIHEAGISLRAVVNTLRPILKAKHYGIMFDDLESVDFEVRNSIFPADAKLSEAEYELHGGVSYDFGFHFDGLPKEDSLTLTTHLTTQGQAKIQLLEPTAKFFSTVTAANFRLEPKLSQLVEDGSTDTDYLSETCHTAHIQAGSLLIFRLIGLRPIVHDFKTTDAPRGAEIGNIVHLRS